MSRRLPSFQCPHCGGEVYPEKRWVREVGDRAIAERLSDLREMPSRWLDGQSLTLFGRVKRPRYSRVMPNNKKTGKSYAQLELRNGWGVVVHADDESLLGYRGRDVRVEGKVILHWSSQSQSWPELYARRIVPLETDPPATPPRR